MEHRQRVLVALEAIMEVFGDISVDPQIVCESLEELRDEILFLLDTLDVKEVN